MNSFTDGSAFCPGAPKRVPSDSAKHRRVYTSSNVCHSHEWRVDTASGKTLKKRNACLHAVRQAVEKKLRVYTASEAKGLSIISEGHFSCKKFCYEQNQGVNEMFVNLSDLWLHVICHFKIQSHNQHNYPNDD